MKIAPWFLCGALAASAGCASPSSFQRAETLGQGTWQLGVEAGVAPRPGEQRGGLPKLDLTARYGLTEHWDVGAGLGSSGLQLASKYQWLSTPGVVASVAPSAAAMFFPQEKTTSVFFTLPVLLGIQAGEHQWVVGPRVQDWWYLDVTTHRHHLGVGTSVGFAYRVNAQASLLPEVGVLFFPGGTPLSPSPWLFQVGLGFLIGS